MALRDHGLGGLLPHDKINSSEQKELSTLTNEQMLEVMQRNIQTSKSVWLFAILTQEASEAIRKGLISSGHL